MELRHLRYFVAVAEELHFGRAAERLHIAQPPLSIQIKQLETELGFRLFDRTNRKVALTRAGQFLLDEVRSSLAGLDRSVAAARRIAMGESGWLGIGFVGSAAYDFLPRVLGRFREAHPGVELVLRELVTARQVQALMEGRIHVGLARPPAAESGVVSQKLYEEPIVSALPADHAKSRERLLRLADLADERFILFPRNPKPSYADLVIDACERNGFTPTVVQEVAEMHTAIALVAGGLGITLVPESVKTESRPGLVFRDLAPLAPHAELAVIYRPNETSPVLHAFLRIARTESIRGPV